MSRVSLDSMFRVSGFEVWAFSMCRFGFLRSGSVLFDWFCFFAGERVLVRVGAELVIFNSWHCQPQGVIPLDLDVPPNYQLTSA